jgi:hypothetical protein
MKREDLDVNKWGDYLDDLLASIEIAREVTAEYYNNVGMLSVNVVIETREKILMECERITHSSLILESVLPFWSHRLNKVKEEALTSAKSGRTVTEAREIYKSQDIYADTQLIVDTISGVVVAGKNVVRAIHKLTDGMSHKTMVSAYTGFTKQEEDDNKFGKAAIFR